MASHDSFSCEKTLTTNGKTYSYFSLPDAERNGLAGVSRLPALDQRGIAAATVSAAGARIGKARSTYEDGILSRVNRHAAAFGLAPGMPARDAIALLRRAIVKETNR